MSSISTPLNHRRQVWPGVLIATVILLVFYVIFGPKELTSELLLAAMSGVFATAFFFYRKHADDTRFMKELLIHFSSRYDLLNNSLQEVLSEQFDKPLDESEKLILIDYFNLCAEEWLFRRAGYVWDPVWESWQNGMRQYARYECVQELWRKESRSNSYYGFVFPGVPPEVLKGLSGDADSPH